MSSKTLMINVNTHRLLKEVSEKRKQEGHPAWPMASIITEMAISLHKRECKK